MIGDGTVMVEGGATVVVEGAKQKLKGGVWCIILTFLS
jgi:hypothetical protein